MLEFRVLASLYIIEFPLPRGGEIKGFGDGEENQRGKKRKKENWGENITFGSIKSLILISKTQFYSIYT